MMNIINFKTLSKEEIEEMNFKQLKEKFIELQDFAKDGNDLLRGLSERRTVLEALLFISLKGQELVVSKKTVRELYNTFVIQMTYDPKTENYIVKGK